MNTRTKKKRMPFGILFFLLLIGDSNNLNAIVRWTIAGDGSTEPNIYLRNTQMQTSPISRTKKEAALMGNVTKLVILFRKAAPK